MLGQLALDEPNKHIAGHGVEFDATLTKEVDLRSACAVRVQSHRLDVGEPPN
jgi:hypothetical protein